MMAFLLTECQGDIGHLLARISDGICMCVLGCLIREDCSVMGTLP